MNILLVPHDKKEKEPGNISKYNYKPKKHVILLMITGDGKGSDGVERWHYLAVKGLSALLIGISSSNDGDFYCLNCFHSYRTLINLRNMKEYAIIMITVM